MRKDSLKFNVVINFIYELLVIVSPLFTAPYISRVLGADGVGTYSYLQSIVSYFSLFALLGTVNYGKREIAKKRNDPIEYSKAFWEIEFVTIITSLICLGLWITVSFAYAEYTTYMLVLSFVIITSLFDISWFYGGLEKFKYTVSINSLVKILSILFIFLFVKTKSDLLIYFIVVSAAGAFGSISMWVFLPITIKKTSISIKGVFTHFKSTLVYFLPTIASGVYTILDKTLIGLLTNDSFENGYYEQATKIINLLKIICYSAVNGVMISRASYLHKINDKAGIEKLTDTTYNINLFLTIGICFGLVAVSSVFVPLFFGDGYDPVINLLYIFSPILLIICISTTIGSLYYVPAGKIKLATLFIIIAAVVNLIFNFCLIPFLGAKGAAIASVTGEFVTMVLHVIFCKKTITFNKLFLLSWKKIVSGVIMLTILLILNKYAFGSFKPIFCLLIDVSLGIVIYFGTSFVLRDRGISLGLDLLKSLFRKKKGEKTQ